MRDTYTHHRSPIPALILATVAILLLLWVGSLVRVAADEFRQMTYNEEGK